MAFGIYKPGQGYWVRMMSAVLLGVLFLVGAAWAWDQMGAAPLPSKGYELTVNTVSGQVAPGTSVTLERLAAGGGYEAVGTATTDEYNAATSQAGVLLVKDVSLAASGATLAEVARVHSEAPSPEFSATVNGRKDLPLFPRLYAQAGVASLVILAGAVVVYWYAGSSRRLVDFLVATDGEMKKVNWSTKKEIIGSTQVVIVAAVLISLILFAIDTGFSSFFRLIGVLES
jgi:preprotein translocase SecE subunit